MKMCTCGECKPWAETRLVADAVNAMAEWVHWLHLTQGIKPRPTFQALNRISGASIQGNNQHVKLSDKLKHNNRHFPVQRMRKIQH